MGKATNQQSNAAVNLGTKRMCPKCNTKFYDFNKPDLMCPKCAAKVDPNDIVGPAVRSVPEPKKSKSVSKDGAEEVLVEPEDLVVGSEEETFEVDDLNDEEVVEDLDVDGEEEQEF